MLAASKEEHGSVERVLKGLYEHFQPVGYLEIYLVEELAVCMLRKRRALRWEMIQQRQASSGLGGQVDLANAKERLRKLLRPHDELPLESSVSTDSKDQPAPAKSIPGEPVPSAEILTTIIRYESANDQKFNRIVIHLERLQRERKAEEWRHRLASPSNYDNLIAIAKLRGRWKPREK